VILAATAALAQNRVTAAWDRNSDSLTRGYRLYYGTASGNYQWSVDVGNNISAPLNLASGRYYSVVRAYNSSNQYGPASNEVTFSVGGTTTNAPTARIQASLQSANSALVSWQTTNATSATLNGTAVPVNGSTTVSVSATTTFTVVARNSAGATASASATVNVTPPSTNRGIPLPPVNMRAAVSGTRATLSWRPNSSGGTPTDYVLYVGTYSWGNNVIRGRSVGNVLSVSSDLRRGSYYARVRARNASGISSSSQQVFFRVGTQLASPTGLTAEWSGTQTTVSWVPSSADSPDMVPTNYILEAGTAPGLADVAAIPLGTTTSFSAEVPTGVYYVRVRATNDNGDSDPTPDIIVAAPGTAQAPAALTSGGEGSTVTLAWTPPAGEAVAGYVIEAGSDPGLSDIAVLPVGNVTTFMTEAPPGTYFVRVRAINDKGPGLPSNEVVVVK
jgi:hypothetical protein